MSTNQLNEPTQQPATASPPADHADAINFGWRVHQSQEAWTAKVDVKASIVLALVGAVLVAIVAGQNKDGVLTTLTGWRDYAVGAAVVMVLVALGFAGGAVFPLLGSGAKHEAQFRTNLIYFGHLRHWDTQELARKLQTMTQAEEIEQLAQQVKVMSEGNWRKHKHLRRALVCAAIAVVLLAVATLWPR
ncbi:Pycsar system effector family protein [Nocardia rhizosphaerihabitans]|uniref:Pycsar system effector family protein n=1 Tax=Nocardia rhizosphaerihabitans TaxID=1691570 RepID=UPI0036732091